MNAANYYQTLTIWALSHQKTESRIIYNKNKWLV